jgi:hypothetical protein
MPFIEGLTNNDLSLYNNFVNQLQSFVLSYQSYISACKANNNTCVGVDSSDVVNKLNSLGINTDGSLDKNGSLAKYQDMINKNPVNGDTVSMNDELLKKKAQVKKETEILTNLDSSIEGDYKTKMNASYYTNTILYVALACFIYFSFYKISSAK